VLAWFRAELLKIGLISWLRSVVLSVTRTVTSGSVVLSPLEFLSKTISVITVCSESDVWRFLLFGNLEILVVLVQSCWEAFLLCSNPFGLPDRDIGLWLSFIRLLLMLSLLTWGSGVILRMFMCTVVSLSRCGEDTGGGIIILGVGLCFLFREGADVHPSSSLSSSSWRRSTFEAWSLSVIALRDACWSGYRSFVFSSLCF